MRFACCAVLAAVLPICLHAAVVASGLQQNEDNYLQQTDGPRDGRAVAEQPTNGNWAMMVRVADECARDPDTTACVAVKAATALERASRIPGNVQVLPGLTLVRNADEGSAQRDSRALPTEDELRSQLIQDPTEDRTSKLTEMVVNSALRFVQSRSLQFKFPHTDPEELSRAIEEGRGKLKKKFMPILGLLAVKIVAVLPVLLGIIGFFALKALVFGKLALLIAGVMALQKYAGSSAGGFGKIAAADTWSTANTASAWPAAAAAPSTNGGYYRRSMDGAAAQQMAYGAQAQPSVQTIA